jgi:hypothetical protein
MEKYTPEFKTLWTLLYKETNCFYDQDELLPFFCEKYFNDALKEYDRQKNLKRKEAAK